MSYSKVVQLGSAGALSISEAGGVAKLSLSIAQSSAASLAGVLKGSLTAEVDVDGKVLVDSALDYLSAKYPSASAVILGLKAIVDAEIANV